MLLFNSNGEWPSEELSLGKRPKPTSHSSILLVSSQSTNKQRDEALDSNAEFTNHYVSFLQSPYSLKMKTLNVKVRSDNI